MSQKRYEIEIVDIGTGEIPVAAQLAKKHFQNKL